MATPAPVVPAPNGKSFINRELHGASFLTLEHAGHMFLAVFVPGLILSASTMALGMWMGGSSISAVFDVSYYHGSSWVNAMGPAGMAAALVVLTPLLVLLGTRTRNEWHKRPAFVGRLAYKIPVYGALAAATAAVIWFKIQIVSVLLTTIMLMGVPDAPYPTIYTHTFVPAVVGFVLFSIAWWYLFALAKGRDYGKIFSLTMALVGVGLAAALYITLFVSLYNTSNSSPSSIKRVPSMIDPYGTYEDLKKSYYR